MRRVAAQVRASLERVKALATADLSDSVRTNVAVVQSAFTTALDGFALPYGDITVGGWRNTPYVVIQNVGAYLDVPRFLDADHPVDTAADAEAYLARLESYARQLDGELGRLQAARALGLVPPRFLPEVLRGYGAGVAHVFGSGAQEHIAALPPEWRTTAAEGAAGG